MKGPINESEMRARGFPNHVIKKFKGGFPIDWMEILIQELVSSESDLQPTKSSIGFDKKNKTNIESALHSKKSGSSSNTVVESPSLMDQDEKTETEDTKSIDRDNTKRTRSNQLKKSRNSKSVSLSPKVKLNQHQKTLEKSSDSSPEYIPDSNSPVIKPLRKSSRHSKTLQMNVIEDKLSPKQSIKCDESNGGPDNHEISNPVPSNIVSPSKTMSFDNDDSTPFVNENDEFVEAYESVNEGRSNRSRKRVSSEKLLQKRNLDRHAEESSNLDEASQPLRTSKRRRLTQRNKTSEPQNEQIIDTPSENDILEISSTTNLNDINKKIKSSSSRSTDVQSNTQENSVTTQQQEVRIPFPPFFF